ncbi:MAG: DNA polymerase III subunit delta [Flavobacteriaceae bacterium]|nr:DNA polymerase III subunit delta [Flavobacteriaceae bacterium]
MNLQEINSIISKIKNKIYSPIYFLMGEETYYIDSITKLLNENVLSDDQESFNKTILYGKDTSVENIISHCKRYPLMSDYQLVVVKEAQDLSRNIELLSEYVLNPLMSTILVINYKYKTLDKRKKLYKNIQKFGNVIDCKKIYENHVPNWVENQLKKDLFTIDPKACYMLVDFLGNDLKKIDNQLNKLKINCLNDKNITPNEIEQYVGISKDFNVFELRSAIGNKDLNKALKICDYLSSNNKQPVQITLTSIFNYFVQLFQYHSLKNKSKNNVAAVIGVNPFFVKDYVESSKNFSMKKISNIISLIKDCDLKSKGLFSTNISNKDLLRQLMVQIFS